MCLTCANYVMYTIMQMQVLSSAIKILYKNTTYISGCGGLFPYGDPPETTYKVAGAIYTLLDAIDK